MIERDHSCAMCENKTPHGTVGKVYEGRFWANRTDEDMRWEASLCPACQTKVKDFINENKTSKAAGVKEIYQDPMGG